jgi:protein-tyrosine phosphatase
VTKSANKRGLAQLGFSQLIATPHIRSAMFDNRRPGLIQAFERFAEGAAELAGMPQLGLSAEHFFDDLFWSLFQEREILPYPSGAAALVELPPDAMPLGLAEQLFRMRVKGVRPVIAHPERYAPLFHSSAPLTPLLDQGALAQLDLMSLLGKYGRMPRRAAERLLREDAYYIACSDCHRPEDVALVGEAIERLRGLSGDDTARRLLAEHPRRILSGEVEND